MAYALTGSLAPLLTRPPNVLRTLEATLVTDNFG